MRSIGVLGAAVTLIGFVVGASVFILPGALAASTGPAVVVTYLLAGLLALFSCGVAAQLGCAFQVNGATVVIGGVLLAPAMAFLVVWLILGGVVISIALMAIGFADNATFIWPELNRTAAAIALVIALGGINLFDVRRVLIGQSVMVAIAKLVLIVLCVVGILSMDFGSLRPFAPEGYRPVLSAVVPAYFSFSGFLVLLELGGEIRNPARSLPLAIALSFMFVLVLYCSVALVMVGNIPWATLAEVKAPLGEIADRILPRGSGAVLAIAAAMAAASTVNVLLLGYSRDIMVLGRLRILPSAVARTASVTGTPSYCVLLLCALAVVAILFAASIVQYAVAAVTGILLVQIALGVAMLRMTYRRPDILAASPLRLSPAASWFFAGGLVILSLALICVSIWETPKTAIFTLCYVALGLSVYAARRLMLRRDGVAIDDTIRSELDRMLGSGDAARNG